MYKCDHCKSLFDDYETRRYSLSVEPPLYEAVGVCPMCGWEDEIEKVTPCKRCGDDFLDSEMTDGFCEDCLLKLFVRFRKFMEQMTDDEINLILDNFDMDSLSGKLDKPSKEVCWQFEMGFDDEV